MRRWMDWNGWTPGRLWWWSAGTLAASTLPSWSSCCRYRRPPSIATGKPPKRGWRLKSGKSADWRLHAASGHGTTMDRARWEQIQSVFHEALNYPASERSSLVAKSCHDDPGLIEDVARMLREVDSDDSVLDCELPRLARELMDESAAAAVSAKFGAYRLKKLLGEGGMAVVWLAEREAIGSKAAIKILRDASLSPTRRRLFAREQQTLAQLNHPSIAQLHDANMLAGGTAYFVMEYVEGETLTDYCRKNKPSLEQMLRLFRSVCEAVSYAHTQAIIHRDLKPTNILVRQDGNVNALAFVF